MKSIIVFIVCLSIVNGITNGSSQVSSLPSSSNDNKVKELKGEENRDISPEYYRGPTGVSALERDRDRYGNLLNRPDGRFNSDKGDFITSPGSRDTRYPTLPTSGYPTSSYPTSSYSSNNRDRISGGSYWPSSNSNNNNNNNNGGRYGGYGPSTGSGTGYSNVGAGGNIGYGYVPGGVYDSNRTPTPYGPPSTVDYNSYNPYPGYDIQVVQDGYDGYGQQNAFGSTFGNGKELSKKVLLPLAGAALLGIAAALVANPVLFQMGVASHGRRKRNTVDDETAQKIAYKGHANR